MEKSAAISGQMGVKPLEASKNNPNLHEFASNPIVIKRKDDNSELLSALDGLAVMNMPLVVKRYAV